MKDATDITILLDRSGSMDAIASDTLGGINAFIREQQALPYGDAVLSLILFDSSGYDRVIDRRPIRDVPPLTVFVPRDSTPLLDAMGRTITETGARLAALPEAERPRSVVQVIVTDGLENASQTYSRQQVFDMVRHQRERYNWLFLYLGANQDAIAVGHSIGIATMAAASYGLRGQNVNAAYRGISSKVADFRAGVNAADIAFTADERGAMDDDTTVAGGTVTSGSVGTTVLPTPTTTTGS